MEDRACGEEEHFGYINGSLCRAFDARFHFLKKSLEWGLIHRVPPYLKLVHNGYNLVFEGLVGDTAFAQIDLVTNKNHRYLE
jgi:hypothetical protein